MSDERPLDEGLDYDLYRKGLAAFERGAFQEAEVLFEASLEVREHWKTLERIGECAWRLRKVDKAIASLEKGAALGRLSKTPHLLAQVYLERGAIAEARRSLEEALRRNPQYHPSLKLLRQLDER